MQRNYAKTGTRLVTRGVHPRRRQAHSVVTKYARRQGSQVHARLSNFNFRLHFNKIRSLDENSNSFPFKFNFLEK